MQQIYYRISKGLTEHLQWRSTTAFLHLHTSHFITGLSVHGLAITRKLLVWICSWLISWVSVSLTDIILQPIAVTVLMMCGVLCSIMTTARRLLHWYIVMYMAVSLQFGEFLNIFQLFFSHFPSCCWLWRLITAGLYCGILLVTVNINPEFILCSHRASNLAFKINAALVVLCV